MVNNVASSEISPSKSSLRMINIKGRTWLIFSPTARILRDFLLNNQLNALTADLLIVASNSPKPNSREAPDAAISTAYVHLHQNQIAAVKR